MKKRVFSDMCDSVYRIVVNTEDWSQGDIDLMKEFGEPDVNVGGDIEYLFNGEAITKSFGDEYARILHGFPYARGFDSRDFSTIDEAVALGVAWKEKVLERIDGKIIELRSKKAPLPTEEVSEI